MEPSTARKGTKMKVIATIDTRAANRGDEPSQKRELEVDVEGATTRLPGTPCSNRSPTAG
jgi:hypothetical protein